ncbi:MAG: hypothetical protein MNPFHGCM_02063 [Gemmatimonadaceae bacterium]|nr:hypothetical protein [Gemmatimonadaceae bacterium]
MSFQLPRSVGVIAATLLLILPACSDPIAIDNRANVSLMTDEAERQAQPPVSIVQNQTLQLTSRLGWSPKFKSMDTAIFRITPKGRARGVRVGSAWAVATNILGKKDSTLVNVSAATASTITVTIPDQNLAPGDTSRAHAVVYDAASVKIVGAPVTWSSSNAAVATVGNAGLVTGVAGGTATITAASGQATANVSVTVSGSGPPPVASVTVSMSSSTLLVGQSLQATAVAKDDLGNVIPGVTFTWTVSSTQILTVTTNGMVTGVASGSASVEAAAFGVTDSLAVAVATQSQPGPNGLTTPAELPRVFLNFPYTPPTGQTIVVNAGGNLQNALNQAQRGDEIVLQAGATFTGNFVLPVKSGTVANGWITIRTDKLSQLPPIGTRVTPAHASLMPRISTYNAAPALATALGASGWRVIGVEFTVPSSWTGPQYALVRLGDGSFLQNSLSEVASDLVLDRVYVHGQTNTDQTRCISLNSARTQISDSYVSECHGLNGIDSQAIQGHNGPGPYKIVNNTLIGATENVVFGGADPAIAGMIPSDIEFRRNYVYTPVSWKGVWLRKNLFEMKSGVRILIEGNVFEGSWVDGQTGWAFMLKSENQSGGCTWCTVSDVTIRYNRIANAGAGFAINGRYGAHPVGALAARFTVQNNLLENINVGPYLGDARFSQVLANAQDVEFTNNTFTSTGHIEQFLLFDLYPSATRVAFNKNASTQGSYGLFANSLGEGTAAFGAVSGGWQFNGNYLIGQARSGYPSGTKWVSSLSSVPAGTGADLATLNAMIAGIVIP